MHFGDLWIRTLSPLSDFLENHFFLPRASSVDFRSERDTEVLNQRSASFSSLSYLHPRPLLIPLQGFHSDGHSPDVYSGPDVGVRSLPVSEGRHCCSIYLHHPQQPAGGANLRHALPSLQTGTDLSAAQRLDIIYWELQSWPVCMFAFVFCSLLAGKRGVRLFSLQHLHITEEEILWLQQY